MIYEVEHEKDAVVNQPTQKDDADKEEDEEDKENNEEVTKKYKYIPVMIDVQKVIEKNKKEKPRNFG